TGGPRVVLVGLGVRDLALGDRAVGREGAPVRHVREGLVHLDGDGVAVHSDALVAGARVGVHALVVGATLEVGVRVVLAGAGREGRRVHAAGHAEGDVLSRDLLAVLAPFHTGADRERPLGVVVVVSTEVGGQVGDQDHLLRGRVVPVLGQ